MANMIPIEHMIIKIRKMLFDHTFSAVLYNKSEVKHIKLECDEYALYSGTSINWSNSGRGPRIDEITVKLLNKRRLKCII